MGCIYGCIRGYTKWGIVLSFKMNGVLNKIDGSGVNIICKCIIDYKWRFQEQQQY